MTYFLWTLLSLSAVLTLCGGMALLFRLTRAGRCGRVMNAVWGIVLLLALIPLRLPEAWLPKSLFGETGSNALIQPSAGTTAAPADPALAFPVIEMPTAPAAGDENADAVNLPTVEIGTILFSLWLCGVVGMAAIALRRNRCLTVMLRACSHPSKDNETQIILIDLAHRAGLQRPPELRILDPDISLPPCTAGFFHPCIYLPSTLPTSPDGHAAILAHEICHIRRHDIWRKLFALTACSVHWFNPMAHVILPRMYEDLEPACDRDTLRLLGGKPARIGYMQTLLEVASITCAPSAQDALFFVGGNRAKSNLKRRFIGMKTKHTRIFSTLALLLICAMVVSAAFLFTACMPAKAADDPHSVLTPLTERIVRYAYNLGANDSITDEMLTGITSIKLAVSPLNVNLEENLAYIASQPELSAARQDKINTFANILREKTLITFTVNGTGAAEGSYEALLTNYGDDSLRIMPCDFYQSIYTSISNSYDQQVIGSFYACKDYAAMESERAKAEMLAIFPGIDKYPTMLIDPNATPLDLMIVYSIYYATGALNAQLLDTTEIDPAIFSVFPNLTTLELVGLTEAK